MTKTIIEQLKTITETVEDLIEKEVLTVLEKITYLPEYQKKTIMYYAFGVNANS